jgi:RNA polymerase sigma factor (sigma-70 family)
VATLSLAVALDRDVIRSAVACPTAEVVRHAVLSPGARDARVTEIDESDASLVERARQGDQRAFGELVSRHQEVAFRAAYLVTRDRDDAADAAQQAFIKACRALGRFRRGSPFRPWLLRIATNEARNLRRAAGARGRLALRVGREPDVGDSPEAHAEAMERRAVLLAALDRCRREDQEIIGYRYFLGLSEAETASALDCPPGTAKSRLSRALGRLRAELASSFDATAEGEPR